MDALWSAAAPYLRARKNDVHIPLSYGFAEALLESFPDAEPDVVLPAILLHDCGYSLVPEEDHLKGLAGAPVGWEPDITRRHEIEGARIAGEILEQVGYDPARIDLIQDIIDGHDSRTSAVSLDDAIVKDADKLWRFTESGVRICCGWMGRTPGDFMDFVESRIDTWLLTDAGRALAREILAESRCASW